MEPVTMTVKEAASRHKGVTEERLQDMCLFGTELLRRHGSREKVPPADAEKALFARKLGKYWYIPVSELDRVFLPAVEESKKRRAIRAS